MELWIRSQDREHLMKTTDIDISCDDKTIILINNYEMAKYKTKERALEVLDEIQKYITPTLNLLDDTLKGKQVCQVGNILSMVYEMPKE